MTDGNYQKHFKNLGKLAFIYDWAVTLATTQDTYRAAALDQAADGSPESLDVTDMYAGYASYWGNGAEALQTLAKNLATDYLRLSYFQDDLTTSPTSATDLNAILTALATDMGAGVDDKTLTTKTTSGLVNFFDILAAEALTWNTEADGTADYKDSVYVVGTVI